MICISQQLHLLIFYMFIYSSFDNLYVAYPSLFFMLDTAAVHFMLYTPVRFYVAHICSQRTIPPIHL